MKTYKCSREDFILAIQEARNLLEALSLLFPNGEAVMFRGGQKNAYVHTVNGVYTVTEAERE